MKSIDGHRGAKLCVILAPIFLPALLAAGSIQAAGTATPYPLLRFPDIQGNTVVFVHAEDIWSVPAAGGVARRLTLDEGEERYPKLSPDGKRIAFTGEIDGNPDVYVMNTDGSDVRRLTYSPGTEEVVGWNPVNGKILFSSTRDSYERFLRLYTVAPDGSGLRALPLHEAARGSFSADGTKLVYNRISRERRTWKRYHGGTAQQLFLYDFTTGKDRRLTHYHGTNRIPMWIDGTIYFSSDRDGILNIWSLDPATGVLKEVTHHKEWDVHRPSADGRNIVYELGGRIWLLDTTTGDTHRIPIEVTPDPRDARPYRTSVTDHITSVSCSPGGARALIVARGDVYSVPREHGPTRALTSSSGARERGAVWSPDGSRVAYLSDRSGEYQIWVEDALGREKPKRLTDFPNGYRHSLRWSPDGKKIAFADSTLSLFIIDVATGRVTKIDQAKYQSMDVSLDAKQISDFSWSPDSRWLTYAKMGPDMVFHLWIYDLANGARHAVAHSIYNDFDPVFSRDGKHLFFVSNRRFDPTFGDFEWEMVYKKVAGIYSLILANDGPPLLPLRDDESGAAKGAGEPKPSRAKKASITPPVKIDFDGLAGRIEALPLPRGNYRRLAAVDDGILYLNADAGDFNRFEFRTPGPFDLKLFNFKDRKEHDVLKGIDGYSLSADASWLTYRKGEKIGMKKAGPSGGKEKDGDTLDLGGLKTRLDPRAEWRQIFREAWRMERDFYYDPNMRGLNWKGLGDKYGQLIDGASCPQDLTYVIGELIGELGTSHTYVFGRDLHRRSQRVNVGMLGARFELDPTSNRYRIAKIYRAPEWTKGLRSPLARLGIHVKEGDYLLAVNGREVTGSRDVYASLQGLAGRQVELAVSSTPSMSGARTVRVVPLRSESELRYLDWVEHNRQIVNKASGGKIGYIHMPDTYLGSARIFPAYYYGQTQKQGLVIDGRFNAGGLDPYIFLERLARKPLSFWTRRNSHDEVAPWMLTRAHLALITDRHAGSGGDMLPMEFREMGLGPIVGTRTWGGLVGVSMFIGLVDGGRLTAPDYRIYTPQGSWIVENEGVQPDYEVWLDPAEMAEGHDAQLAKAIAIVSTAIEKDPRPWPTHPDIPVAARHRAPSPGALTTP